MRRKRLRTAQLVVITTVMVLSGCGGDSGGFGEKTCTSSNQLVICLASKSMPGGKVLLHGTIEAAQPGDEWKIDGTANGIVAADGTGAFDLLAATPGDMVTVEVGSSKLTTRIPDAG